MTIDQAVILLRAAQPLYATDGRRISDCVYVTESALKVVLDHVSPQRPAEPEPDLFGGPA